MAINSPATQIWIAHVVTPAGAENLYLDDDEARQFNENPDAFAAKHFGLSKIDYIQWIGCDGAPLCKHRTKTGDLCRNMTGRIQMRPKDWKKQHRQSYCSSHDPAKRKAK